jgi:hypothetical protein
MGQYIAIDGARMPNVRHANKEWQWLIVVYECLTGFTWVTAAHVNTNLQDANRPMSRFSWEALQSFIQAIRNETNNPNWNPRLLIRDGASDMSGQQFQQRLTAAATANPGFYMQTVTPAAPGRSSYNPVERINKIVRKMVYSRYHAHEAQNLPGDYSWARPAEIAWINQNINDYWNQTTKTTARKALT